MTKLKENELYYAWVILSMFFKGRNFSLKTEELESANPAEIIKWLNENGLLITIKLEAEGRFIENRTVLGMRALNILETTVFPSDRLKLLKNINEGR